MIIDDVDKYFKKAWKHSWGAMDIEGINTITNYKINIIPKLKEYDIDIYNNENDDYLKLDDFLATKNL